MILRIPTTRGSNYATERPLFLQLYEGDLLTDDLNVDPQSGWWSGRLLRRAEPQVLTSGRRFRGGWGSSRATSITDWDTTFV